MALAGLLTRGIRSTLDAHGSELEPLALRHGLPAGAGEHLAQTIEAIPGLLVALDREVQLGEPAARAMWSQLLSYLLLDEDLIPSRDGAPIEGLLDDAYLIHAVVARVLRTLSGHTRLDPRSISGGFELLGSALPPGVRADLDARIEAALANPAGS